MTELERFMSKVRKIDSGCWEWMGGRDQDGYGRFYIRSYKDGALKNVRAHRFAYQIFIGSIPMSLTIDHLCRNRACVNPLHLQPVTNKENILRGNGMSVRNAQKTHCIRGHEFNAKNTYIDKNGWRWCRACRCVREKVRRERCKAR